MDAAVVLVSKPAVTDVPYHPADEPSGTRHTLPPANHSNTVDNELAWSVVSGGRFHRAVSTVVNRTMSKNAI